MPDLQAPESISDAVAAHVLEGLRETMTRPIGSGALDLIGGYSSRDGGFARLQANYRPLSNLGLYAQAEASTQLGAYAGIGLHLDF